MKRGAANCPKMKALGRDLAKLLGVDPMVGRHVATSLMHRLWEWAAEYAPTGDLTSIEIEDLAEDLLWPVDPESMMDALLRRGWVDEAGGRRGIHDWPDHCEDTVHRKVSRSRAFFWDGTVPKLSRLSDAERAELQAWYAENPAPAVRKSDTEDAHDVRTPGARNAPQPSPALPSPALPCPALPSQESAAEPAAPDPGEPDPDAAGEFPEESDALLELFLAYVRECHPKAKIPRNTADWSNQLGLMIRRDGHTADEIAAVIGWLQRENPLREKQFVVMAPVSLREKFPRLWEASHRRPPARASPRGSRPLIPDRDEWADLERNGT